MKNLLPSAYTEANRKFWNVEQIETYLPLVKRIAGRLAMSLPPHIDEDDLVGHGVFGLLDAVKRYDPSRGVKFETYASLRIRGSMIDGLRMMDWVPHSARQRIKRVQETFNEIEGSLGRPATSEEVGERLSLSLREIEDILIQSQLTSLTSYDEIACTSDGENTGPFINNLIDLDAEKAFQYVENQEKHKIVEEAIDKLPEKEKLVVALYYQEELTLKEIAATLNLSESRISQLHSKAILRLRGRLSRQKKNFL